MQDLCGLCIICTALFPPDRPSPVRAHAGKADEKNRKDAPLSDPAGNPSADKSRR